MSQPVLVKAVGFAFFSPEAFVLMANHTRDHIHLFPPKHSNQSLKFKKENRRQVIALRALERLSGLSQYADKIGLVIAFGDSADLMDLGIPLMDAELDEDGKVVARPRQHVEELFARIENEAVDLRLDREFSAVKRARRQADSAVVYKGPTFREQMRAIRDEVKKANGSGKFSFVDEAAVPAMHRLMGDTTQEDFKSACQGMITRGGASEDVVKSFFRWVEGFDGIGPELGKAVETLLYSDDDIERTEEDVAQQYGVDVKDVALVANSYKQLTETD